MSEAVNELTLHYFLPRAAAGVSAGYALRVVEHVLWCLGGDKLRQSRRECIGFCVMILPFCAIFGATVGYALTVVAAVFTKSTVVTELAAYFGAALFAFVADDIRELLRRITRV